MATNIPEVQNYTGEVALRSDPDNFPQNAEDQYSYLATLSTGLNSTVTAMNAVATETEQTSLSASASAEVAASNASFKGLWSAQTGAATVPYSVSNNGRNWQLLTNLVDVTASEPLDGSADWQELTTGTSDLQAAALAAGTTYNDIIYATDLVSPIPGYLFKADEQIPYSVPTEAQGKFIQSVVNGVLTTTDSSTYQLQTPTEITEALLIGDAIHPEAEGAYASSGDTVPVGAKYLRLSVGIVPLYPKSAGGSLSSLSGKYCEIGGVAHSIGSSFNIESDKEQINSKSSTYNISKVAPASIQLAEAMYNYDGQRRFRRINYISDSTGYGQGTDGGTPLTTNQYRLSVVAKLREMIGNSIGEGFVPPHDPRISFAGANTQFADSWANYGNRIALSTSGSVTVSNMHRSNYIEVLMRGQLSDSSFDVYIDGSLVGTRAISGSGSTGLEVISFDYTDGLTTGSELYLECTSGYVEVEGFIFRNRKFSGLNKNPIEVNRMCRGGAKVSDMITTGSKLVHSYMSGYGSTTTGLSVINLTANDYNQQTSLLQYKLDMQELINDVTSGASGSVILVAGLIRQTELAIPQREYDAILYELSDENPKVAVLDVSIYQDVLGGASYLDDKGLYQDTIHLNANGYYAMATWIYDAIKHLLPRSNRWDAAPIKNLVVGNSSDIIDDTTNGYLMPISNDYGNLVQKIQISVLSGTTGNLRVGLYKDNGSTLERAWFGESLNYTGGAGVLSFNVNYELESFNYYVAVSFSGDISLKGDSDIFDGHSIKTAEINAGTVIPSIDKTTCVSGESVKVVLTINGN